MEERGGHERELLDGAPIVGNPLDLDELERVMGGAMAWVMKHEVQRERQLEAERAAKRELLLAMR